MSLQKKALVLALAMVALIIPLLAVSGIAAAAGELDNSSISAHGFDNRSSGTVTVKVLNGEATERTVNVYITEWSISNDVTTWDASKNNFASATVTFTEEDESKTVSLGFRNDSVGTHQARVIVTDTEGNILTQMGFDYTVGRSIWSNTWTYVAIVIVILVIVIAAWLRMRGNPKVDSAGAYTAMEEERRASRSKGAKKEEYKGREERKSKKK
jgi:hypothetical protein